MEKFTTSAALRDFVSERKSRKQTVAFVPTMGALHEGHRSCVEIARRQGGELLVVSLFVNPTQFASGEDLKNYPATLKIDLERCKEWGCDVVFAPSAGEIYPAKQVTWVTVERLSEPLCGGSRPGHFRGVATVVSKLFNIVEPDIAVFGQKDAQQALVIRELVRQLNLSIQIVLSPVVREPDGLACSSRNGLLSADERLRATGIYAALRTGLDALVRGERRPAAVCRVVRDRLEKERIEYVEYVELIMAQDLTGVERAEGKMLLAVAARVGATRLIDNLVLDVGRDVEEVLLF